MASPGTSSFCGGMGYLFCIAMVTSMLWYLFWMVLEPVQEDIAPIVNWYDLMVSRVRNVQTMHYFLQVFLHKAELEEGDGFLWWSEGRPILATTLGSGGLHPLQGFHHLQELPNTLVAGEAQPQPLK